MSSKPFQFFSYFRKPHIMTLVGLGFVSGLPYETISNLLTLWANDLKLSLDFIQLIPFLTFFYSFKFLLAPFLDRYPLPFIGKRSGWMFVLQILMGVSFLLFAFINPLNDPFFWFCNSAALALFSALYDVVYDAYRIEILDSDERSIGTTISIFGYRLTRVFSGVLVFLLLSTQGWSIIFLIHAICLICIALVSLKFSKQEEPVQLQSTWTEVLITPWFDLLRHSQFAILLVLIVFYKLGDSLSKVFAVRFFTEVGLFTTETISLVNNILPLPFWFLGALIASYFHTKRGLFFCLWVFSIFQAIANLSYITIIYIPNNLITLVLVSFFENTTAGMFTAPFIVFLMSMCKRSSSASQFALLSALSTLNFVFSGFIANRLLILVNNQWDLFFIGCCLASIPTLILLYRAKPYFQQQL